MKITKRQLKKIIHEAMPPGGVPDVVGAVTGVYGEEERQLLNDLGGMYSDMYKELYRRRPKIPMFKTIEEAEAAVEEIWGEYAAKNRSREAREKEKLEFIEMQRRMQEMMPGEYDIELPKHSGMGRRTEGKIIITRERLRKIIREIMDVDLEVGDVILTGKFKNKRKIVKDFSKDDLGQPTINGMKALNFRIEKLMPKDKWSKKSKEALEFADNVNEIKRQRRKRKSKKRKP